MIKNKNTAWRIFSVLGLIQILFWNALPASAGLFGGGISIPSASDWASQIEKRYNLNPDEIRSQGQLFNVSNQKSITPQVSLYFSPSDPKPGEKITAIALPAYFSTNDNQLYYTWYLKHSSCDLKKGGLTDREKEICDRDNDGDITVEDWKIEAMRIIASNEFDYGAAFARGDYDSTINTTNDNDGYRARFGGDSAVSVPNHCYYHDNQSGTNYEIVKSGQTEGIHYTGCDGDNLHPVCMNGNGEITPGTLDLSATGGGADSGAGTATGGDASASGETFETGATNDALAGFPICNGGTIQCYSGTPCCVGGSIAMATSCTDMTGATCTTGGMSMGDLQCKHLFPNAIGGTTGNGSFGLDEEAFWNTNPKDPDTAENGNKDEANVAGLGQSRFSWNYIQGDLVGVVVEGTSMLPTKYNDSSSMIMWAFSKNNCPISLADGTGQFQTTQSGYAVNIPTIDIDLNKCIAYLDGNGKEHDLNLTNPAEGGQATNLDVAVTSSTENPQDDNTGRGDGDIVEALASVSNAGKGSNDTFYDWKVQIASDPSGPWTNITPALQSLPNGHEILSPTRGNGVNKVRMKLDLKNSDVVDRLSGNTIGDYLDGNSAYLKFSVDVAEKFDADVNRKGRGSVVVRFSTAGDKIQAYTVDAVGNPAHVILSGTEICSGAVNPSDTLDKQALDKLEGKLCRVLSSEIIGLKIENIGGIFSNFSWSVNGKPLVCNTKVSTQCFDDRQGNITFFPIVGNPGETFTVSLTANKISTSSDPADSTEKSVNLSRTFKIVTPQVEIMSGDENLAWPKVLGQYIDTDGNAFLDTSKQTLETLPGSNVTLQANFIPSFLTATVPPKIERAWVVDGESIGDGAANQISFVTNKPEGSIYNIGLDVVYRPPTSIRKALEDIWGISGLDSTEEYFSATAQLEHPLSADFGRLTGPKKYLALLSSYLPASLLFSLRVMLSIGLILFVSSLVFSVSGAISPGGRYLSRR